MKTKIILPLLALALLLAACGKNERSVRKVATKDKTVAASTKILNETDLSPDDVLSVTRRGEKVTLRWDADFSDCKEISILRNSVDKAKNRQTVAHIPASSTEYVDTVPNTRVYWYWISVSTNDNKSKRFGPVRARADAGKTGEYTGASKGMSLIAQRTASSVVVAWDLPKDEYREITIWRRNKPEHTQGRNQRTLVLKTTERSGDVMDTLPDANASYWYWIEAIKADGTVRSKGPAKATFTIKGGKSK